MTTEQAPATGARRLNDEQLLAVLRLIRSADTVELKATVPVANHREAIQGLAFDPIEAQPRQVYFFDTPDLALSAAGVVVRGRRVQGGRGDTVVKLRPVEPDALDADLRRQADFGVEVDVLPGGFVCSASFKGRADASEIRDAATGALPIRRLFSKTQRQFYRAHAPEGLTLDDLVALGPTFVLKARSQLELGPSNARRVQPLVAEMWFYPDGSRILELSTKCAPADALIVATETRAALLERGIVIATEQQTKTRTALEYYAGVLADAANADADAPDGRDGDR
jgi:hypothetical protein